MPTDPASLTETAGTGTDRPVVRNRWRLWVGASTAVAAALSFAIGVTTPPRSGPNCRADCLSYPYTGGGQFVPRDFWWMYPASVTALLAIALIAGMPVRTSPGARLAHRFSISLATIAAGVLVCDYGLQLAVVQPALAKGETDGLGLLSQYNPHGVFIGLEDVGYLLLALAFLAVAGAIAARRGSFRAARLVLLTGGAATVLTLVGLAVGYRADLDYRFEVAGLSIVWLVLIATGILLGRVNDGPDGTGLGADPH